MNSEIIYAYTRSQAVAEGGQIAGLLCWVCYPFAMLCAGQTICLLGWCRIDRRGARRDCYPFAILSSIVLREQARDSKSREAHELKFIKRTKQLIILNKIHFYPCGVKVVVGDGFEPSKA